MSKINPSDHLATLKNCGGYYECPKDSHSKRLGPLVGYAGTYDPEGSLHYVGDVYYNFARAEQYPEVRDHFAQQMSHQFPFSDADVFLGSPMGGILLAGDLARINGKRVIFAEKKITAPAVGKQREESSLVIDRHELRPGDRVIIVEDVCNNFSTTYQLIHRVNDFGGTVTGIACFLNRSPHIVIPATDLSVWNLLHIPTVQFQQDDPSVIDDIKAGNVAWKPKREWDKLAAAMSLDPALTA